MTCIPATARKALTLASLIFFFCVYSQLSSSALPAATVAAQATPTPCVAIASAVFNWKQTDAAWANAPYAALTGPADKFKRWGSGVTALAMLLAQAGVATDPGKLNDWMRAQPYAYGPQGSVNFSRVVSRLTGASSFYDLGSYYFDQSLTGLSNATDLAAALCKGYPVLLMVDNPHGGKHYVVALAKEGNSFRIADPAYNATRLDQTFTVPLANGSTMAFNYQNRFMIRGFVVRSDHPAPVVPTQTAYGGLIRRLVVSTAENVEFNLEGPYAGPRYIGYNPITKTYGQPASDGAYVKEFIGGTEAGAGVKGGANLLYLFHPFFAYPGAHLKFYGTQIGMTEPVFEFYERPGQLPSQYRFPVELRAGLSGGWATSPGRGFRWVGMVTPTRVFAYENTITASAAQVAPGAQVTFKVVTRNLGPDTPQRGMLYVDFSEQFEVLSAKTEYGNYCSPCFGFNGLPGNRYNVLAGQSRTLEIVARVKANAPPGTKLVVLARMPLGNDKFGEEQADEEFFNRVFQHDVSTDEQRFVKYEVQVSSAPSFIAGGIVVQYGAPVADAVVDFQRLSGTGAVPTTVASSAAGRWQQAGFSPGSIYRVTPRKAGFVITPAYRDVGTTQAALDFVARPIQLFAVSGSVRKPTGQALPNVIVSFERMVGNGALPVPVLTDASGRWQQAGFEVGTQYRAMAAQTGAFFLPPTRTFSAVTSELHFVGDTLRPFRAGGYVVGAQGQRIANAKIIFELRSGIGPIPAPVLTDANGHWEQSGFQRDALYGASANLTGYVFTPALMTFTAEINNLNCSAYVDPFTLGGVVLTAQGAALPNVLLTFTRVTGTGAVPASVLTDARGRWQQTGFRAGTTYRVTPSKANTQFDRTFSDATGPLNDLQFRAK